MQICQRCTKRLPIDPEDSGIHTCTPTPLVRGLEARVAELETAIATHQKERLPHMTNAHDRALWSLINP